MTGMSLLFIFAFLILAYQRAALLIWTMSIAILLALTFYFYGVTFSTAITLIIFIIIFGLLNIPALRKKFITRALFKFYCAHMPSMSATEKEAIAAGTVGWEGELFRGKPNWHQFLKRQKAQLSQEEQSFLEGPVETLCSMLNDWEITHDYADLSPEVWQFLKTNGFFGLIIPKQYGGKAFSAYAHSQIITKIGGVSITAGSTVSVPNSLGPAELLLHYGTDEQKNYYLPRLARGEEIPCFALTSPYAGSDASAMIDFGIVCRDQFNGVDTLGIRLTFDKRYITLAPIATIIGLAFKLYDPDHLLGQKEEIGITCALIPRQTPGIKVGRRHLPLNSVFQNGPVSGDAIFIPMDMVIGGAAQVGQGWKMLMECLAAGRAISLPSISVGGAKVACFSSGAYSRIRKQFNQPIGKFEGIEEVLARIATYTFIADSARIFATAEIDRGEKPAVASAIVKYHCTELGRKVACDAMDIHGGKGICLGPNNYLGRGYEAIPIAITVEGANILTRNMIIFGQGLMRCHPYLYAELNAAKIGENKEGLHAFDKVVMKHIGFAFCNTIRTLLLGLTFAKITQTPKGRLKYYYQQATRFSSALALLIDNCLLIYGGKLKRKEFMSARLGDMLSYLYLISAILKRYHDDGENEADLPLVHGALSFCLIQIQESMTDILHNLPNRFLAFVLRVIIFPWGKHLSKARDSMTRKVARVLFEPNETQNRLINGMYLPNDDGYMMANLQTALQTTLATEPLEKLIHAAVKSGDIEGYSLKEQAHEALKSGIIDQNQYNDLLKAQNACMKVISVDDFSNEELSRKQYKNEEERIS